MLDNYKICSRCIMDTSDPDIEFDKRDICNHCKKYDERVKSELYYDEAGHVKLRQLVKKIIAEGRNKEYDCIIGVSGGLDSTFAAYNVKKLGLRPMAVHLDNGWNSELAVRNIENMLNKLDIDLYTYVIDWEEFKDLHLSFLKASVVNSEIPTDHAITAQLYRTAVKMGVKYIINGGNIVTEAIAPKSWWGHDQNDWKHIKAIQKKHGKVKFKTYPHLSLFDWVYNTFIKKIKFIPILNYIHYNKKDAISTLEKEIGFKFYEAKHYESIYTRFYQSYILPEKFGFDKRRGYLSALVCSKQITRDEALEEMNKDICPEDQLKQDKEYVIKKLCLTDNEFNEIISTSVKSHLEYPSNDMLFNRLNFIVKLARKTATYN